MINFNKKHNAMYTNQANKARDMIEDLQHPPKTHTLLPYLGLNKIILAVITIRITVVAYSRIGRSFAVVAFRGV